MTQFVADDFNTGLCSCTEDSASCSEVFWCYCCQISRQYNVIHTDKPEFHCPCCFGVFIFGNWGVIISAIMVRSAMTEKYFLRQEQPCQTCCKALLCPACSTCQVYRELSIRNKWPGGSCCIDAPYSHPTIKAPTTQTMMNVVHTVPQATQVVMGQPQYTQQQQSQYYQPVGQQPSNGIVYAQPHSASPPAHEPYAQQPTGYAEQQTTVAKKKIIQ